MRAVVKYHIVSYTVIKSLLLQLFLCIKLYVNKILILPNNLCVSNLFITHTHTHTHIYSNFLVCYSEPALFVNSEEWLAVSLG